MKNLPINTYAFFSVAVEVEREASEVMVGTKYRKKITAATAHRVMFSSPPSYET
jgi:hypothetical protein